MQPPFVVNLLDEAGQVSCDVFKGFVLGGVDSFDLQRLHEALGVGAVIGVAATAHGADKPVLLQDPPVCAGRVLNAAIRMEQASRQRLSLFDCRSERSRCQTAGLCACQARIQQLSATKGLDAVTAPQYGLLRSHLGTPMPSGAVTASRPCYS